LVDKEGIFKERPKPEKLELIRHARGKRLEKNGSSDSLKLARLARVERSAEESAALDAMFAEIDLAPAQHERTRRIALIQDEITKAKAEVGRKSAERLAADERGYRMLKPMTEARAQILAERLNDGRSENISDSALAKALNAMALNDPTLRPPRSNEWGHKSVRSVLFRADDLMIEHAVFECRTRMTVRALSADFTKSLDVVHELERHYLEIIADALDLGHRLRGEFVRDRPTLMKDALQRAQEVATRQRAGKSYGMRARERLWEGFAPIERKVFDAH
jgi:hypothetical protein